MDQNISVITFYSRPISSPQGLYLKYYSSARKNLVVFYFNISEKDIKETNLNENLQSLISML